MPTVLLIQSKLTQLVFLLFCVAKTNDLFIFITPLVKITNLCIGLLVVSIVSFYCKNLGLIIT